MAIRANVTCHVWSEGKTDPEPITLAKLKLHPIDIVFLAASNVDSVRVADFTQPHAYPSELDRQVIQAATGWPTRIDYNGDTKSGQVSFGQTLELARAVRTLLGSARTLQPTDLAVSEDQEEAEQTAKYEVEDLYQRAQSVYTGVSEAIQSLSGVTTPDDPKAATALAEASLFGISSSLRLGNVTTRGFVEAAQNAKTELEQRLEIA